MSGSHSTLIFRRAPKEMPRAALKLFAGELELKISGGRHFTCLITSDEELRRLNRQFLDHDYPTDVLSFPEPGPDGFLGEMAISADRAAEQAREFGHTLDTEIRILMLHGLLHLMGMNHERDRGKMARAERGYRRELGLPAGLIERVRP
ncbi:MAG: rRNA maturation RNase YbeY [Bryobacteraceae bacterium]